MARALPDARVAADFRCGPGFWVKGRLAGSGSVLTITGRTRTGRVGSQLQHEDWTMANNGKWIPEGHHQIVPHIVVRGAAQAIAYYERAFGAEELCRHTDPNSNLVMHAEVRIGDSRLFLHDEFPQMGSLSPQGLNGTPVTIHLWVDDVDTVFDRAVQAGAQVIMPVSDQFWGDRFGMLTDPFGHRWSLATHLREVSPEELKQAAAGACAGA